MMQRQSLLNRVERLEKTVDGLQTLPADVAALGERVGAVELQILQFRNDMGAEFSAMRGETKAEFAAVRGETKTEFAAVRAETKAEFAAVRAETKTEFAAVRAEIAALREEMHGGFAAARDEMLVGLANVTSELGRQIQAAAEEGRRYTRVLFEELVSRIATLGEHREIVAGRKPRGRRKR